MRYWYDTEFDEDGTTIKLISIGIVSADRREYYAVSNEFDPEKCSDWVKTNVLPHLPPKETWKPSWKIAKEVQAFCSARGQRPEFWSYCSAYDWVVLCRLYGNMSRLPDGWPRYCNDIRQMRAELGNLDMPEQTGTKHDALADARWHKEAYEKMKAVVDARKAFAIAAINAMRG